MTTKTTTESPIKTVQVTGCWSGYGHGPLQPEIDKAVAEHIAEGWTLFAINVANEPCAHGTGSLLAFISFIR